MVLRVFDCFAFWTLGVGHQSSVLIDKHGYDADVIAIRRATKMLDDGDVEGYAVWKRIVDAIKDTQREKPRPGEKRH